MESGAEAESRTAVFDQGIKHEDIAQQKISKTILLCFGDRIGEVEGKLPNAMFMRVRKYRVRRWKSGSPSVNI